MIVNMSIKVTILGELAVKISISRKEHTAHFINISIFRRFEH